MTTVFENNHDAGGAVTSYWNNVIDSGSKLSITVGSALNGSARGLNAELGTATSKIVQEFVSPPASSEFRARYFFDPNSATVTGASNVTMSHFRVRSGGSVSNVLLQVRYTDSTGEYKLWGEKRDDSDVVAVALFGGTGLLDLTDGPHCVEIREVRESTSSSNDGQRMIYLDGILVSSATDVDNFARFGAIDVIEMTFVSSADGVGNFYADEVIMDDDADADLGCSAGPATNEWTAAPMKKPCAVDMDGSFIYIAALDSLGQPALIKFSTGLSSDGTVVFQPGAGDDIGVQCGRKDADVIWIGGDFGGGDVLEKSEDAGASWTVKDPGTFDAVKTFALAPTDDAHILAVTNVDSSAVSGEIQLSVDDGATWQTVNAATGVVGTDVAILDKNSDEIVLGGQSPSEVNYSVNDGADLEDVSASGPTHDTNKLIVG